MEPAETFHPWEYVDDELKIRGIPPHMAFRMLNRMVKLPVTEWLAFMDGGPVTENIAQGLAQLFGTSPVIWLRLQRAYDHHHPVH